MPHTTSHWSAWLLSQKPLLKMMHKRAPKHVAKDIQTKDMDQWNQVLWSDETKLNLFGSDGVKHVEGTRASDVFLALESSSGSEHTKEQTTLPPHKQGGHSHQFKVKFQNDDVKYTIDCGQPRTVLEVIKSHLKEEFQMMKDKSMNYSDEKIIIQQSNESIVATHFPCSCIDDDECLTIHCKTEEVEETKSEHDRILPREKYSVFYISKEGGKNARKMKLFKSRTVKDFKVLCVYAMKGTSVKEALEKDGRFVDLEGCKLSEDENSDEHTLLTETVDSLDQKQFDICLPKQKTAEANYASEQTNSEQQEQPSTSKQSQQKFDTKSVLDAAQKSGISVKRAMEETDSKVNTEEIYKLMCEQFPHLKILMEETFPGDSYQKALELKKEDFGKIQQSFGDVHRVKKLLELGESVCKVIVKGVTKGTGFVLFDRFILTNAHLFKKCIKENKLNEGTEVYALFNYDEPEPNTNYYTFTAENTFIDFDLDLDYAILELNPKGQKQNQTAETGGAKAPPGLLSKFGPPPLNGEACLIGHPAREVKKIDPTCIIPMEKRKEAVDKQLHPYKDKLFIIQRINRKLEDKGIDSIMMGGSKADKVVTYDTFMYHGASGSPVFDAQCRVVGLHSSGYCQKFLKHSVIEFARPLLSIFENFVRNLEKGGNQQLLERIQAVGKGNSDLEEIIESVVGPRQTEHEGQLEETEEE